MVENPFVSMKTTEVHITSEPVHSDDSSQEGRPRDEENPTETKRAYDPYSITIGSNSNDKSGNAQVQMTSAYKTPRARAPRTAAMESNRAAMAYARVSLLFFAAILVTWVSQRLNPPLCTSLTRCPGPFDHQPCLFSSSPRRCLLRSQLHVRPCPTTPRFLEFAHLHLHLHSSYQITVARYPRHRSLRQPQLPSHQPSH